jgi:LemA protein
LGKVALILLVLIVGVVLVLGLSGVGIYNRLVSLSQAVDAQWSQVENVYQRRADLVPNLVATVQGAADFEKSTLSAVTEARASVGKVQVSGKALLDNPQAFAQFQAAQDGLSSALSRLLVVSEKYPQLTATQGFRDLQGQIESTENRVSVERMRFNEAARAYNTARSQFPAHVVARLGGFRKKPYFKAQSGAEEAPKVEFKPGASPEAHPARP